MHSLFQRLSRNCRPAPSKRGKGEYAQWRLRDALIAAVVGMSRSLLLGLVQAEDHDRFAAVLRLLLKHGTDPNIRSEKYGTAMDVATTGGWLWYRTKLLLAEYEAMVS